MLGSVTAITQLQGMTRQIAIHRHPQPTFRFIHYLEAEQLPGKAHARSRSRYRKRHTIEASNGHVRRKGRSRSTVFGNRPWSRSERT